MRECNKMKNFFIENKEIGENCATFIIAEVGSNHNRNLAQAKRLIEVAGDAGADAVKFQTFSAEKIYSKKTITPDYLKGKINQSSVWKLIKDLEMPREWLGELADYSKSRDLIFLSSPFDYEAITELEELHMAAYKVASFEIVDLQFLKAIAKTKKPIILSTGMASLGDIEDAINAIRKVSNHGISLLHCAINYPPPFKDLNLRAIKTLKQAFQVPIGYSDHTMSTFIPSICVSLGACIIEKHFTLDRALKGPDHVFALEPNELKEMIENIRKTEVALGSPIKFRPKSEDSLYKLARRSIIARKKIPRGKIIEESDLIIKRPGYGIAPKFLNIIIGRITREEIDEDTIITWDMI